MRPANLDSVIHPIRRTWTLAGDGSCHVERAVSCPERGGSVDAASCVRCERFVTLHGLGRAGARVECAPSSRAPEVDRRADLREGALRTPVHAVMGLYAVCVRTDASLETAARLLVDNDFRALPVVDAEGKLVGIVGRTDLLRERTFEGDSAPEPAPPALGPGFHVEQAAGSLVSDVMTRAVHALPEHAPLSYAVALMAVENVLQVPVVTDDGRVVGVLGAAEVLGWVAKALGYVLAEPGAPERHESTRCTR